MYPVTQDFMDSMRADLRKVDAKVTIDYTDPFMDQSITLAASEQANVSYPQQAADGLSSATYKWASLDGSWILDGNYRLAPMPEDINQYQFGWWGSSLSGADGSFASPYPSLTLNHIPRPVHTLRVSGDSARGEYPVDFTIDLYAQDGTLLKSQSVTGNTLVNWSMTLPVPVLDVAKQVLTITKWSHPGRQVKIMEFFTSIQETYGAGDVLEIRLLEERESDQGSLPVGNISANEISLRLANTGRKFDVTNIESPLWGLLKPNRRVKAWLGAMAENPATDKPSSFSRPSVAYLSDGTQVAVNQPRFENGKYGKAVMAEEGTTNLLPSNDATGRTLFSSNNSSYSTNSLVSDFGRSDSYSIKSTQLQADTNRGFYTLLYTVSPNVSYAASAYVYTTLSNKQFVLYIAWYDSSGAYISQTTYSPVIINANSWTRLTNTGVAPANAASCRIICVESTLSAVGEVYYFDDIQLEQKPYATSFINGTRSPETLTIPTTGVMEGLSSWTIEFWGKQVVSTNRGQGWLDGRWSSGIPILVGLNAAKVLQVYYMDGNNVNTGWITNYTVASPTTFHYYAVTYDIVTQTMCVFCDGVKVGERSGVTIAANSGTQAFFLGWDRGSTPNQGNVIIDSFRISSRARTDEEILSSYLSNAPLPKDEDTTYLLSFNGSIYPVEQVWVPLGTFWSMDWDSQDDTMEASVTARDRLELLRKSTYQPPGVQQNVSLYTLAQQVLQDAGLQPSEYVIDSALQQTIIPWAYLTPMSHREALRIIAEAALAVVYADRDGKIRIESLSCGSGSPVLSLTADDYFSPLQAPSNQDQVANEIVVTTQPLKPDSVPSEVYRTNTPISVPAGETVKVTIQYQQPPVIEASVSLDNPPAGVSISNVSYYAWGAEVAITNTSAVSASVIIVATGKPLSVQGSEQIIARDPISITENGTLLYEFPSNPLVQTVAQAQNIANALLASVKDPRRDIQVNWRGNPALELGDVISLNKNYAVIRQEIIWDGALHATLTGRKIE